MTAVRFALCLLVACSFVALGNRGNLCAQQTKTAEESKTGQALPPWRRYCEETMARTRLTSVKSPSTEFKRLEKPVLISQQPVRSGSVGAVYMWIDDQKRPVAIVDVFVAPEEERSGTHYCGEEFHSLYDEPIEGRLSNGSRWKTSGPGLKWSLIPNQDRTPRSLSRMLVQTRAITGDMKAHGIDWRRRDERQPYRILRQPLHTYKVDGEGKRKTMGCVFGICLATDPEIIYSIEARTDANGKTKWYEAFAELSDMRLSVERDGEVIWSRRSTNFSNNGPHTIAMARFVTLPEE